MIPGRFLPEAEAEFAEAAAFYEAAEPGLGLAFAQEVERTVDRICAFPESGATLGTVVRRAIVSNFPFLIVYRIGSGEILIAAVAHQRRRPGYWRRRSDVSRPGD